MQKISLLLTLLLVFSTNLNARNIRPIQDAGLNQVFDFEMLLVETVLPVPQEQIDALIDLYQSTNGDNWTRNDNWLSSSVSPCEWYGVECRSIFVGYDQYDNLIYQETIYLIDTSESSSSNGVGLEGEMPDSIGNLIDLEFVNLSYNKLTGSIPDSIGNLVKLKNLYLQGNQLSGSIPASIGNLVQLKYLALNNNQLSGSIPDTIGALVNLQSLNIEDNQLSGTIPQSIGNLASLTYLALSTNELSGELPQSIGALSSLTYLFLNENQLTGKLDPALGNLNVQYLSLGSNQFSGDLPDFWGNMTSLISLELSFNQFSGDLPASLGNLTNLRGLGLSNNQFTGNVPATFGNLANLTSLRLENNLLSGQLPSEVLQLFDSKMLELGGNSDWLNLLWNEQLGLVYTEALATTYPNLFQNIKDYTYKFKYWLGSQSCYADIELFEKELTGWMGSMCSSDATTCPESGTGPSCIVGNPINLRTGVKQQSETDFSSSRSPQLKVQRRYNSQNREWLFNVNPSFLYISSSSTRVKYQGRSYRFICSSTLCTPMNDEQHKGYTLTFQDSIYEFTTPSGAKEGFNSEGVLISTSNSQGQTLQYTQGVDSVTITDDFGEQIIVSLSNDDVTSVNTSQGTFSYGYNEQGRLSSVTKPDNTTVNYFYDEPQYSTLGGSLGLLTGKEDALGQRIASWYYDAQQRAYRSENGDGAIVTEINFVSDNGWSTVNEELVFTPRVRERIGELGDKLRYTFKAPEGIRAEKIEHFDNADNLTGTEHFEYDENGFNISHTDQHGLITLYTRDTKGRELSRTERSGTLQERVITTEYYGDTNQPTSITTPETQTLLTYASFSGGLLLSKQEVIDLATEESRITEFGYNQDGLLTSINGARTDVMDVTQFEYNAQGLRNKTINALGHIVEVTEFNALGQPVIIIDQNNSTISIEYDVMGRMTRYAHGNYVSNFEYDDNGNLTKNTLVDGSFIYYEYDAAYRLTAQEDSEGNRIEYVLDGAGNRLDKTIKDPQGTLQFKAQQQFDEFSQLVALTDGNENTTVTGYLSDGLLDSVTDAAAHETRYAYNAIAQLSDITEPSGAITRFTYDNAGRAETVTDAEGIQTIYQYNGFGELIEEDNPNTGNITYTYDAAGNLTQKTQTVGTDTRTTQYAYDALNRLIGVGDSSYNMVYFYDNPAGGEGAIGQLVATSSNGVANIFQYDVRGNITSNAIQVAGQQPVAIGFEYNNADNLTGVSYPDGRQVNYAYDSAGRVNSVSMSIDGETIVLADNITYLPFGAVNSVSLGNGLTKSVTYDLNYQPESEIIGSVSSLSYQYSVRNNITAIDNLLMPQNNQTFSYSPVNALTSATGWYGTRAYEYDLVLNRTASTFSGNTETYTYQADTHLLQSVSGSQSHDYTYNAFGETIAKDDMAFTYNGMGQMVSATYGETTNYLYSHLGQRIVKTSPSGTTFYWYSPNGQLLAEADENFTITRSYIYLNNQPLAMVSRLPALDFVEDIIVDNDSTDTLATGAWTQETDRKNNQYGTDYHLASGGSGNTFQWLPQLYGGTYEVYGYWLEDRKNSDFVPVTVVHSGTTNTVYIDQTQNGSQWNLLGTFEFTGNGGEYVEFSDINGRTVADAIRFVRINVPGQMENVTSYIHTNHIGAPIALTDNNGNKVWDAQYQPFGLATVNEDVDGDTRNITMNMRFPGQYFDSETGLHYNWHRYYDAETGRYITSDPLGLDDGPNTYAYAHQNPVMKTDITGLATYKCIVPLHSIGGSGDRSGPDIWGNPFYHQYSCVIGPDGKEICGGQDRSGSALSSPGKPSEGDSYEPEQCEKTQDDNECFEQCLIDAWTKPRPRYGIPFGTDCQEYDDDVNRKCEQKCNVKKKWPWEK